MRWLSLTFLPQNTRKKTKRFQKKQKLSQKYFKFNESPNSNKSLNKTNAKLLVISISRYREKKSFFEADKVVCEKHCEIAIEKKAYQENSWQYG